MIDLKQECEKKRKKIAIAAAAEKEILTKNKLMLVVQVLMTGAVIIFLLTVYSLLHVARNSAEFVINILNLGINVPLFIGSWLTCIWIKNKIKKLKVLVDNQ